MMQHEKAMRAVISHSTNALQQVVDLNRYVLIAFVLTTLSVPNLHVTNRVSAQETLQPCKDSFKTPITRVYPRMPNNKRALDQVRRQEQKVTVQFVLQPDGSVDNVRPTSFSNRLFVKSAKKALNKTKFKRPENACTMSYSFTFKVS